MTDSNHSWLLWGANKLSEHVRDGGEVVSYKCSRCGHILLVKRPESSTAPPEWEALRLGISRCEVLKTGWQVL